MFLDLLLLPLLALGADPVPEPEDVKAGWGAFAIFIALIVAVALLGWSLTKHLRTARTNADAGAFGPTGSDSGADADSDADSGRPQG